MGVLGEMFPGPRVLDEAAEAGDGQGWRLGPLDLENGTVDVVRSGEPRPDQPDPDAD